MQMSWMLVVVLVTVWRCWTAADDRGAAEGVQERRVLLLERVRPHIVERNIRPAYGPRRLSVEEEQRDGVCLVAQEPAGKAKGPHPVVAVVVRRMCLKMVEILLELACMMKYLM